MANKEMFMDALGVACETKPENALKAFLALKGKDQNFLHILKDGVDYDDKHSNKVYVSISKSDFSMAYIGKTINPLALRWKGHAKGKTPFDKIYSENVEGFITFVVGSFNTEEEMNKMEDSLIKELDTKANGYNSIVHNSNATLSQKEMAMNSNAKDVVVIEKVVEVPVEKVVEKTVYVQKQETDLLKGECAVVTCDTGVFNKGEVVYIKNIIFGKATITQWEQHRNQLIEITVDSNELSPVVTGYQLEKEFELYAKKDEFAKNKFSKEIEEVNKKVEIKNKKAQDKEKQNLDAWEKSLLMSL